MWFSKNHLLQQRPQGLFLMYGLLVSGQSSPIPTIMLMGKDLWFSFLWCLFSLTEPEYMKDSVLTKTPESMHHGQHSFAGRSLCCRVGF